MITELNRTRISGAMYSGKKFLSILPLGIPLLIHSAIGFAKSRSFKSFKGILQSEV